jgi:hypothetical protein
MAQSQFSSPDVQQQALPDVQMTDSATVDNFGGGKAAEALGAATQGVAQTAGDIAAKEKDKADQTALLAADSQASALQNQIQINTGKMLGKDAMGAPDYASKQWSDGVNQIQSGLYNNAQKMAFARSVASRGDELNKTVQSHVGTQMQAFADNETQGFLDTSKNAAVLNANDDDRVQAELDRQTAVTQDLASRKGIPQDSQQYQNLLTNTLSQTNKAVLQARLDKDSPDNVQQAKDYFDDHKDQMTAADVLASQKSIDTAETVSLGMQEWQKVGGMQLSNGMPDESRMEATVMALPNTSDERKLQILQFVKGRAREQVVQTHMENAADDNDFNNAAVKARKDGAPLQDALKLASQFASDDYDQSTKENTIRQMYAPPSQSDAPTYMALWEKVQDGSATRQDIDAASQAQKINPGDWRGLREMYYKSNTEGLDPQSKIVDERVKGMAQAAISDKNQLNQFLYVYHTATQDQEPQQKLKTATDLLGPGPDTHWYNSTKLYNTNAQKLDASNLGWGQLQSDVGADQTKAIGQGVATSTGKPWGLGDVDAFAAQFGGYSNIKVGTPVNNAMQSIMKRGELVTPANINTVLQKYPDGKY